MIEVLFRRPSPARRSGQAEMSPGWKGNSKPHTWGGITPCLPAGCLESSFAEKDLETLGGSRPTMSTSTHFFPPLSSVIVSNLALRCLHTRHFQYAPFF